MAGENDFLKFNNGQEFRFSNFKEIREEDLKNADSETKRLFNIFAGDDHILQANEAESLWDKLKSAATSNKNGDNSVFEDDEMQAFIDSDEEIRSAQPESKFSLNALMSLIQNVFSNNSQEVIGNTITDRFDENGIIERTISNIDKNQNNITTVIQYQNNKPIKQTRSVNNEIIATISYDYSKDEENPTTTTIFRNDIGVVEELYVPNNRRVLTQYNSSSVENFDKNNSHRLQQVVVYDNAQYVAEYDGKGNTIIIVQNSEIPESIAQKFGITFSQLAKVNKGLTKNTTLQAGQKLIVPGEFDANARVMYSRKSEDEVKAIAYNHAFGRVYDKIYASAIEEYTIEANNAGKNVYEYAEKYLIRHGAKKTDKGFAERVNDLANELLVLNGKNAKYITGAKIQYIKKTLSQTTINELKQAGMEPNKQNWIFYQRFNYLEPQQQKNVIGVLKQCKAKGITNQQEINAEIVKYYPEIQLFETDDAKLQKPTKAMARSYMAQYLLQQIDAIIAMYNQTATSDQSLWTFGQGLLVELQDLLHVSAKFINDNLGTAFAEGDSRVNLAPMLNKLREECLNLVVLADMEEKNKNEDFEKKKNIPGWEGSQFDKKFNELFNGKSMNYNAVIKYLEAIIEFQKAPQAEQNNKNSNAYKKLEAATTKFSKEMPNFDQVAKRIEGWSKGTQFVGGLVDLGLQVALMYLSGGGSAIARSSMYVGNATRYSVGSAVGRLAVSDETKFVMKESAAIMASMLTSSAETSAFFQGTKVLAALEDGKVTKQEIGIIEEGFEGLFKFSMVGSAIAGPLGAKVSELTTKALNSEPMIARVIQTSIEGNGTTLDKVLKALAENSNALSKFVEFGTSFSINAGYMMVDENEQIRKYNKELGLDQEETTYLESMGNLGAMDAVSKLVVAMLGGKNTAFLTPQKVQQIKTSLAGYDVKLTVFKGKKIYEVTDKAGTKTRLANEQELLLFIIDKEVGILKDVPNLLKGTLENSDMTVQRAKIENPGERVTDATFLETLGTVELPTGTVNIKEIAKEFVDSYQKSPKAALTTKDVIIYGEDGRASGIRTIDEQGNILEERALSLSEYNGGDVVREYDSQGRLISETQYMGDKLSEQIIYSGNKVYKTLYENGEPSDYYIFKLESYNNASATVSTEIMHFGRNWKLLDVSQYDPYTRSYTEITYNDVDLKYDVDASHLKPVENFIYNIEKPSFVVEKLNLPRDNQSRTDVNLNLVLVPDEGIPEITKVDENGNIQRYNSSQRLIGGTKASQQGYKGNYTIVPIAEGGYKEVYKELGITDVYSKDGVYLYTERVPAPEGDIEIFDLDHLYVGFIDFVDGVEKIIEYPDGKQIKYAQGYTETSFNGVTETVYTNGLVLKSYFDKQNRPVLETSQTGNFTRTADNPAIYPDAKYLVDGVKFSVALDKNQNPLYYIFKDGKVYKAVLKENGQYGIGQQIDIDALRLETETLAETSPVAEPKIETVTSPAAEPKAEVVEVNSDNVSNLSVSKIDDPLVQEEPVEKQQFEIKLGNAIRDIKYLFPPYNKLTRNQLKVIKYIDIQFRNGIDKRVIDAVADRINDSAPFVLFKYLSKLNTVGEIEQFIKEHTVKSKTQIRNKNMEMEDVEYEVVEIDGYKWCAPEYAKEVILNIQALKKFLNTQSIPEEIQVSRTDGIEVMSNIRVGDKTIAQLMSEVGVDGDPSELLNILNSGETVVTYDNFVGTTMFNKGKPSSMQEVSEPRLQWEITVPEGSEGAFLENITKENIMDEMEFLLQAGSQFRIKSAEFINGIWYLKAELKKKLEGEVKDSELEEVAPFAERLTRTLDISDLTNPEIELVKLENGYNDSEGNFVSDKTYTLMETGNPFDKGVTYKRYANEEVKLASSVDELLEQLAPNSKEDVKEYKTKFNKILKHHPEITIEDLSEMFFDLMKSDENFPKDKIVDIISRINEYNIELAKVLCTDKDFPKDKIVDIIRDITESNAKSKIEIYNLKNDENFPKDKIVDILCCTRETNIELAKVLCTDKDFPKDRIVDIIRDITENNAKSKVEIYNLMKSDESFPKVKIVDIINQTNETNIELAKVLCGDTDFPKDQIAGIIRYTNKDNVKSKIEMYNLLKSNKNFPKYTIPGIIRFTRETNIELAKLLCGDKDFPKDQIADIICRTNETNIELAKVLCGDKDFPKDQIVDILCCTNEENIELAKLLCGDTDFPKDQIADIIRDITENNAKSKVEIYNLMKSDENFPKDRIVYILCCTRETNIELAKVLCGDTDFPKDQIVGIIRDTNKDNVKSKVEIYNLMKSDENFPKDRIVDILCCTNETNIELAKVLCADEDFPKDKIASIIRNTNEENIELAKLLCGDKDFLKDKIAYILGNITENNVKSKIEIYNLMKSDKNFPKDEFEYIINQTNETNIELAKVLCGDTDFPKDQIAGIIRYTNKDNVKSKIEMYNLLKSNKNFPKYTIPGIIRFTRETNIELAKLLCGDKDFPKDKIADIICRTNETNIELAKVLCADEDFPKDQIADIIHDITENDAKSKIEIYNLMKSNKKYSKAEIVKMLKVVDEYNYILLKEMFSQGLSIETQTKVLDATIINDPNDDGGNNGKVDSKKVERYTRLFQNPKTAEWVIKMLNDNFDIETISKLAATKQNFYTEGSVTNPSNNEKIEVESAHIVVENAETINLFASLGLEEKQINFIMKAITKDGIVNMKLQQAAVELINKGIAGNKIGDILNSAQISGEYNPKIIEDFILLQNLGLNPLLEKNLAILNNLSGADVAVKFNSNVKKQLKGMLNGLSEDVKVKLQDNGFDIASIQTKLDTQIVRTSEKIPSKAKVVSGFRSRTKITGFEKLVVDKYEPVAEIWRNEEATKEWAESKYQEIRSREYISTRNTSEDPELGAKVTQKRKEMLQEWYDFMESDEEVKENPFIKVILCDFITQELDPERSTLPPVFDKAVVKEILSNASNSTNFSLGNAYSKKMKDISEQGSKGLKVEVNGIKGTWYTVPKTDTSSPNFKANAAKVRAFSDGTNWCIRTWNAEPYIQKGNIHFFVDETGLTQVCIRESGPNSIAEIQKRQQNQTIPVAYIDVIQDFIAKKELKGCEEKIEEAVKQKPEFDAKREKLQQYAQEQNYKAILEGMGITVNVLENGTWEISHYSPLLKGIALNDYGISENELLANVSIIKGDATFKDSNATSLPLLQEVGGKLDFGYANISNLKSLQTINGKKIDW